MVRVRDLEASLRFYCDGLGLKQVRRTDNDKGRFSLIFLAAPEDTELGKGPGLRPQAEVELTWNWPDENGKVEDYGGGRNFGTWPMRSTTSTPPAGIFRTWALSSTAHRAMA